MFSDPDSRCSPEAVVSVNFDLSAVLNPMEGEPVTVIRVAPRPPADRPHELRGGAPATARARVVHVAGGHTNFGEPLVPLDTAKLEAVAREASVRGRYVVTSVGSLINPAHELEAGRILLEHADPVSVVYSHSFQSSSFATRERTGVVNSLLIPVAESFANSFVQVTGKLLPHARLYVTTNDGGCVPLARLSVSPVHSMLAERSSEFIGGAALWGLDDGRLVVAGGEQTVAGEMIFGVPTVRQQFTARPGAALSTKMANLTALGEGSRHPFPGCPVVRAPAAADGSPLPALLADAPLLEAEIDLCALGAACAPLSDWAHRIVMIQSEDEMERAIAVAEARVRTRLVSFGASPSDVRIIESRTVGMAYENPSLISVRVRGVAGPSVSSLIVGGEARAARR